MLWVSKFTVFSLIDSICSLTNVNEIQLDVQKSYQIDDKNTLLAVICIVLFNFDKVWMYEEIMTNNDNLESNLLTSILLKMLVQVPLQAEPEICVEVVWLESY